MSVGLAGPARHSIAGSYLGAQPGGFIGEALFA